MQTGVTLRLAFTLLELLLVLVLVGISVAAVVPNLNGTVRAWQLRETARNLEATLRLASQWACAKQEEVAFVVNVRRGTFTLRPLRGDRSAAPQAIPAVGHQSFGDYVEVKHIEGFEEMGQERVLVFRPDGTSEAATIVLTDGAAAFSRGSLWEITLNGRGVVYCQERLADGKGD